MNIYDRFPTIETRHYIMRELKIEDAEQLFCCYSDKDTFIYKDWNGFSEISQMTRCLQSWRQEYKSHHYIRWGIVKKDENILIGSIESAPIPQNLRFYDENCDNAIFHYELWNQYVDEQIIEELFSELVNFNFVNLYINNVITKVNINNQAVISGLKNIGFHITEDIYDLGLMANELFMIRFKLSP